MPNYYVNKVKRNGHHEVHQESVCPHPPDWSNRVGLGYFISCHSAVAEAKRLNYTPANGCYYCSNACHTS